MSVATLDLGRLSLLPPSLQGGPDLRTRSLGGTAVYGPRARHSRKSRPAPTFTVGVFVSRKGNMSTPKA